MGEICSAVDGVDDPTVALRFFRLRFVVSAAFFTKDLVIGMVCFDVFDDCVFAGFIYFSDEIAGIAVFEGYFEVALLEIDLDLCCFFGSSDR